jgi:hypothetical protein
MPAARTRDASAVGTALATVLAALLLLLSFLVWPPFLERHVSLDWRLGNMRPAAYLLQATLAGGAILAVVCRRSLGARFVVRFHSPRTFVFALLTVTSAVIVTLVALEITCRLLDLPERFRVPLAANVAATFDPELGWAYQPNHSVVSTFASDERKITSHFDELGARVRAPGTTHDPAVPTVLFVGDSFTMGHGVTFEESFVGRLEGMPGLPYQVVDLGVQGFGTDQALLMLERNFKRFNTKVVVYTFIEDHVVRNSNYDRRVLQPNANTPGTKPLFGLRPDGTLYLRKTPYRLADHPPAPRLWEYLQIAWNRVGPRPSVPLTVALVDEMRRFTEANGAAFILVYWRGQEAHPTPRMTSFDALAIDMVDTGVPAPAGWESWTLPGDPHPDARAHAYVAGLLYDTLTRLRPSAVRAAPAASSEHPSR